MEAPHPQEQRDRQLRDAVCERLNSAPDIEASGIEVRVQHGTVTLHGTIPDLEMRHRIQTLCRAVSGIVLVREQLRTR